RERLAAGPTGGAPLLELLGEYGISAVAAAAVSDAAGALAAADAIGYPVVLKTDEPAIAHKSDVGGVLLGIADPGALAAGYADLGAGRRGAGGRAGHPALQPLTRTQPARGPATPPAADRRRSAGRDVAAGRCGDTPGSGRPRVVRVRLAQRRPGLRAGELGRI